MAAKDCTNVFAGYKRPLIDNGNGTHTVPLSQGKFAIIDSSLADAVGRFNWYFDNGGYAMTVLYTPTRMVVFLHHLVIGRPLNGLQVDHINRDGLDNRSCNLRIVTNRGNGGNRTDKSKTGFVGVRANKNKFRAVIRLNGKSMYIGSRDTPQEAGRLYDAALRVFHEDISLGNGNTAINIEDLSTVKDALKRSGLWAYYIECGRIRVSKM